MTASSFAMAQHALLAIGLLGLGAVAVVQVRARHEEQQRTASRPGRRERDAQVLDLHSPIGSRSLGSRTTGSDSAWASLWLSRPQLPVSERIVVPVAFVSCAAAASVHAALGVQQLRDSLLLGTFFLVSALLQLGWTGILAAHRTRALLVLGALGNLSLLGLWTLTRTSGLPFGLLPEPIAVGRWDLACSAWQLVVAASCVALLGGARTRGPVAAWREWHRSVHVYVAGSLLVLIVLTLSGAVS